MKKILTAAIVASMLLAACGNKDKDEEQKQMKEVIALHDKVMAYDSKATASKTILDSLVKKEDGLAKDTLQMLSRDLDYADKAMSIWMEKFNPDFSGKSHNDVMTYLGSQKQRIAKVDSLFTAALSKSSTYLQQHKAK